jgi:hypothetical protein
VTTTPSQTGITLIEDELLDAAIDDELGRQREFLNRSLDVSEREVFEVRLSEDLDDLRRHLRRTSTGTLELVRVPHRNLLHYGVDGRASTLAEA